MTTATPPNPLASGFHPDPSVLRVGDDYYLANSTFEYLPGIPVQHSRDLVTWTPIGNVVVREDQLAVADVPTLGGAWAPTIRHHDGRFWIAVTDAMGRGTLVFHAQDAAGPWSEGTVLQGFDGIDPDLAWDEDGTCYVTYSALHLGSGTHGGIEQVRVDLETGTLLEEPRSLWSGTGRMFPEGPHLYRIGDWWYLLIAEGGTERGHSVSIARGTRPDGPFEGGPANPLLTAAGTDRPVQNTGHGDLVQAPDGSWYLVLLGMRTLGGTRAFSPLGRETFITRVTWDEDGWPALEPVLLTPPAAPVEWEDTFDAPVLDDRWLAVRRLPASVSTLEPGRLVVHGTGTDLTDLRPAFVGVRQAQLRSRFTAVVDPRDGVGGVAMRYDERHVVSLTVSATAIVATARVSSIAQSWAAPRPAGPVTVWVATEPIGTGGDFMDHLACDHVLLGYDGPDGPVELARIDGRYYSAETAASFAGRVVGVFAVEGDLLVESARYSGSDA